MPPIAHRLVSVRQLHRIIVMDKGRIVEGGSHDTLGAKPQGLYAHLWKMQDGGKAAPSTQATPATGVAL